LSNLKREQEIAVKDLLLGKNVLTVLPTGYGKSLIFTLFLLARENITRIKTDGRRVFIASPTGLTGLLRLGLLAASLSELCKAFFNTRLR
jgi:Lhr-like helicase